MCFYGVLGKAEPVLDLLGVQGFSDEHENLELPCGDKASHGFGKPFRVMVERCWDVHYFPRYLP